MKTALVAYDTWAGALALVLWGCDWCGEEPPAPFGSAEHSGGIIESDASDGYPHLTMLT